MSQIFQYSALIIFGLGIVYKLIAQHISHKDLLKRVATQDSKLYNQDITIATHRRELETIVREQEAKQQSKVDEMIREWRDMRSDFATLRTDIGWIKSALQTKTH